MSDSNRKLVMIPGPIEFSDAVLESMSTKSQAHTSPEFVKVFQDTLLKTRKLFKSEPESKSQAIVLSGSGTLGWDLVGTNLLESDKENVLVLSTGFFSDSFAECLSYYTDNVDVITAKLGDQPDVAEVEKALKSKTYKIITITHVDTSTAVLTDVAKIAKLVKSVSPETLIVVDGVCSVAVEQLQFDNWGLDFVLTASQKAIGVPSGLSISIISQRATAIVEQNKRKLNFYANLKKWLPIMVAYENGTGAYFATPSIQLVHALNTSLTEILSNSLDSRFEANHQASVQFKQNLQSIGLKLVSLKPESSANGLTAVYFPESITGPDLLAKISSKGINLAGGIHKDIKTKYFRVGHMGVSALNRRNNGKTDIELTFEVIKESLSELGYSN